MVKKTITFTNYNDEQVTKTCYFNISKAEALDMEMTVSGGFAAKIQTAIDSKDRSAMYTMFRDMVLLSYGEKSDDGNRFIKSKELTDAFQQSQAYDELMMEICTDADAATEFFNGIIPKIENPVPAPANK